MSTVKKVRVHVQTEDGLVGIHPETTLDQVLDPTTGLSLGSILANIGSSQKFDSYGKLIKSTSDGQTRFEFDDPAFSEEDTILVFVSGEFMHIGEDFTIDTSGMKPAIVFNNGYPSGVGVYVLILRNSSDSNNSGFADNKIEAYKHVVRAQFENQKGFKLPDIFDIVTDTIIDVAKDGEVLNAEQYKVESGSIQLTNGVPKGTTISFTVLKYVPLKEQDSSLQAGDLSAGYYGKVNGLITSDELFEKVGLIAGDNTYSGDITWLKFSHNYKTLLIADRALRQSVSWDDLQAQDLIKGKPIEIDGKYYLCRTMTGGNGNPSTGAGGEWNELIAEFTPDRVDSNWDKALEWSQEMPESDITKRVRRGGMSLNFYTTGNSDLNTTAAYYRPVLELL